MVPRPPESVDRGFGSRRRPPTNQPMSEGLGGGRGYWSVCPASGARASKRVPSAIRRMPDASCNPLQDARLKGRVPCPRFWVWLPPTPAVPTGAGRTSSADLSAIERAPPPWLPGWDPEAMSAVADSAGSSSEPTVRVEGGSPHGLPPPPAYVPNTRSGSRARRLRWSLCGIAGIDATGRRRSTYSTGAARGRSGPRRRCATRPGRACGLGHHERPRECGEHGRPVPSVQRGPLGYARGRQQLGPFFVDGDVRRSANGVREKRDRKPRAIAGRART